MSVTPVSVKTQVLSSYLKERLKKCGRYHASPSPVVRGTQASRVPAVVTNTSTPSSSQKRPRNTFETDNNDARCTTSSSPKKPRNTFEIDKSDARVSDPTPVVELDNSSKPLTDIDKICDCENVSDLNTISSAKLAQKESSQTPLSQRSRLNMKVKGSKLSFEEAMLNDRTPEDVKHIHSLPEKSPDKASEEDTEAEITGDSRSFSEMSRSGEAIQMSHILKELHRNEEDLRKLQMVKMYRHKNDLNELQRLIDKWREVSQLAVQDLHTAMPEPKPSLTELINHLGIDHQLIRFKSSQDEETFY